MSGKAFDHGNYHFDNNVHKLWTMIKIKGIVNGHKTQGVQFNTDSSCFL